MKLKPSQIIFRLTVLAGVLAVIVIVQIVAMGFLLLRDDDTPVDPTRIPPQTQLWLDLTATATLPSYEATYVAAEASAWATLSVTPSPTFTPSTTPTPSYTPWPRVTPTPARSPQPSDDAITASNADRVIEVDWKGRATVGDLAWSSDNNALAFSNGSTGVMFYYRDREIELGKAFVRFDPPDDPVFCVDISPNGELVAAGTNTTTISVWNYHTKNPVPMEAVRYTGEINAITFSPDGTLIAAGGQDHSIHLWDAITGQHLHVFEGHNDTVVDLAFRPDGQQLASASWDNWVMVWDMTTFESRVLSSSQYNAYSVVYSADGNFLAAGFGNGTSMVRNTETGDRKVLHAPSAVYALAFSPDGSILASGHGDGPIILWDVHEFDIAASLDGHTGSVTALEFSPDGVLLASSSEDDGIRYWGVAFSRQNTADQQN